METSLCKSHDEKCAEQLYTFDTEEKRSFWSSSSHYECKVACVMQCPGICSTLTPNNWWFFTDTPALYQHVVHHGFGHGPLIPIHFGCSKEEKFANNLSTPQTFGSDEDGMDDDAIYQAPDAMDAMAAISDNEMEPVERHMRRNSSVVETRRRMLWSEQTKVSGKDTLISF